MWDAFAGDNVTVRTDEVCGPYIMIEPARIALVQKLFKSHGISFQVDEDEEGCKGGPEAAVIEFGKNADVEKIQRVLDSVQ